MKRWLIILGVLVIFAAGLWAETGLSSISWLFASGYYNAWNYGEDWRLVSTLVDPSLTGRVLLFYQRTDGTVAVHLYETGTGFGRCINPVVGLPVACGPGMVIAPTSR